MNYTLNLETGRIELTDLSKEGYKNLEKNLKSDVKRYFLFLRSMNVWGSKATKNYPEIDWKIGKILKELGFTNQLVTGEQLSYSEQIDKKAQKAEHRKERYLKKAENAENKATDLQSGYKKHSGDIAFVTQPNINSSKGRSFTNYRNKLIARYEKSFEEYRKSEEYKQKAVTADRTATMQNLKNKAYLQNRIDECDSMLRSINRLIKTLDKEAENNTKAINHESSYNNKLILLEQYMDKKAFFLNCLDELGGLNYSKENIKKGYFVKIRNSIFEVIRANPKTVTVKTPFGNNIKYNYAEIEKIIDIKKELKSSK